MACPSKCAARPCPFPNIAEAEGFRRRGKPDKARYMNIAEGSLEECRYYLILAQDLGYGDTTKLSSTAEEISRLLSAYAAAILVCDSPPTR
jgi:four helix bundle protein